MNDFKIKDRKTFYRTFPGIYSYLLKQDCKLLDKYLPKERVTAPKQDTYTKIVRLKPKDFELLFSRKSYKGLKNKHSFKHKKCGSVFLATPDNILRSWTKGNPGCGNCHHVISSKKRRIFTDSQIYQAYSKCKSVKELKEKYLGEYTAATNRQIHNTLCAQYKYEHFSSISNTSRLEEFIQKAKKCKSKEEFKKRFSKEYKRVLWHNLSKIVFKNFPKNVRFKSVKNLDTGHFFENMVAAGKSCGRSRGAITFAIKNGTKCGGCRWAYCDENGNVID